VTLLDLITISGFWHLYRKIFEFCVNIIGEVTRSNSSHAEEPTVDTETGSYGGVWGFFLPPVEYQSCAVIVLSIDS
jgi:hypothetical protein